MKTNTTTTQIKQYTFVLSSLLCIQSFVNSVKSDRWKSSANDLALNCLNWPPIQNHFLKKAQVRAYPGPRVSLSTGERNSGTRVARATRFAVYQFKPDFRFVTPLLTEKKQKKGTTRRSTTLKDSFQTEVLSHFEVISSQGVFVLFCYEGLVQNKDLG